MSLNAIKDDFGLLDDWEDRYRYVIELGKTLEPIGESARQEQNKVRGCASQVWLVSGLVTQEQDPGGKAHLHFTGDSDALIVRGLIAILFAIVNDRPAAEILELKPEATFDELGLRTHLTPQRSNGLAAMIQRIRRDAQGVLLNSGEAPTGVAHN